jgi:xylulokinase
MSLLGIDVGTTGCKAVVFSEEGTTVSSAYAEYDFQSPGPGLAELDGPAVWDKIKAAVRGAVAGSPRDPATALAVCSLGEAVVPVTSDRKILGPSLLGFDPRGGEYVERLASFRDSERFYRINGNSPGNNYGLTKLLWVRDHRPQLYEAADRFLLWGSLAAFMLGGEPVVDYSLANRMLLFDLRKEDWSDELLKDAGLARDKLPRTVPAGSLAGEVSRSAAAELGLKAGTPIVVGAHDQCANAVGCGVVAEGQAMFGMGTYPCIVPVFDRIQNPGAMLERGLNTEHHAVADMYVSFIYNQGGSIVKWYRDTFAAAEKRDLGLKVYDLLNAELTEKPSPVLVLPHFTVMGPPWFIPDSCGLVVGLQLDTSRAEIYQGILEGIVFSLRECVDMLPGVNIRIGDFRAVGGGSRSDAWVRITADIMSRPVVKLEVAEAGALGAALMAGVGKGIFSSLNDGIRAMVREGERFEPNPGRAELYEERFCLFKQLWPLAGDFLRELHRKNRQLPDRR